MNGPAVSKQVSVSANGRQAGADFPDGSTLGRRGGVRLPRPLRQPGAGVGDPPCGRAGLLRHADETRAGRRWSWGGPNLPLSTDTATTETGTTPTACPLPHTGQRTGGRACTGQRPPPGTYRSATVPVRVGADCGTGAGDRSGRRGALDRNTQGEVVATSAMGLPLHGHVCGLFCVSARSVHVCGPFLLPIFRWGIDSSSSPPSASDGPSGEAAGMETNKWRLTLDLASTLQRRLKVWRSRASSCPGAVKPPSTGRLTKGEADTPFIGSAMRHSQHALGAPSGRYAVRPPAEGAGLQQKGRSSTPVVDLSWFARLLGTHPVKLLPLRARPANL